MKTARKQAIVQWLQQRLSNIQLIYLFGSAVFEQQVTSGVEPSDIDLAILLESPLDPVERWDLQQQLACDLNQDIDLIDLQQASTVLQQQIIGKGECLYSRDDYDLTFSLKVMSQYQQLNRERADLLVDFMGVKEGE